MLVGQTLIWGVTLAVLGGVAASWIITGWQSTEIPTSQKNFPELSEVEQNKRENQKENKFQKRKPTRYRRQPQKSWFFWKNPRRPPKKRR
ncbi:hypothetical protein NIES2119_10605 [[Phormidium ambiguum] IAM M-71]|uniref:Uncharacterized protein n=1 Tax=[Phormidium ambiguum] IAM M-71 TaxID=454136 RepID=A0A1U7IMM8_9CYAN|nr:hypothetical protein [Phormidium ambiguum]OKH38468.1 hypothetical protein NIES2119_10605 [Phormidium ambiguum IAM M-71]